MGAIIERSVKRGNVRTLDASYKLGFKTAWASEVDADFDILFDAWNHGLDGSLALADGSVTTAKLADFAVTVEKMAANSVGAGQIINGTVGTPELQDGSVTSTKLAADSVSDVNIVDVSWSKITGAPTSLPPSGAAGGDLTGTYPAPTIQAGAVTRAKTAADLWLPPIPDSGDIGKVLTVQSGPTLEWMLPSGGGGDTLWVDDAGVQMLLPASASYGIALPAAGDGLVFRHSTYPTIDRRTGIDADDSTLQIHGGSSGILVKSQNSAAIWATFNPDGTIRATTDPVDPLDLATKQYVDANAGGGAAGPDRTFRTITGTLTLDGSAEVHVTTGITSATLPLASSCPGRVYEFFVPSGTNLTLNRSGSDTFLTAASTSTTVFTASANYRYMFMSDGTSKWVLVSSDPSNPGGLAGGSLSGTYPNPTLASNSVNNVQIATGAIQPPKLGGVAPVAGDAGKVLVLDTTNPTTQFKISPIVTTAAGALSTSDTLNVATAASGTTPLATYKTGSATVRMRLGSLTAGNFQLYTNADFTNAKDDVNKPSLAWVFDAIAQEFGFYNAPIGGIATWAQMMALNTVLTQIFSGNVVVGPASGVTTRVQNSPTETGGGIFVNRNWLGANAQDNVARISWGLSLKTDTDQMLLQRSAAGSTTQVSMCAVSCTGPSSDMTTLALARPGGTVLSRLVAHQNDTLYISQNADISGNIQDDGTKPSWVLQLGTTASDSFRVRRSVPGTLALTDHLTVVAGGDLIINGANATKATGTAWINPSDRRLKDEISDFTQGLTELMGLQPRTFVYNGLAGSIQGQRGYGFIADEVKNHCPEMVRIKRARMRSVDPKEEDVQHLDTSNLTLILTNAVKELAARVEALEKKEAKP